MFRGFSAWIQLIFIINLNLELQLVHLKPWAAEFNLKIITCSLHFLSPFNSAHIHFLLLFSNRQIQSKNREIAEDDPRIPNRFKKDQNDCGIQGENMHMRDLLRQGKIPQRFLSEQMLENNFTQFWWRWSLVFSEI